MNFKESVRTNELRPQRVLLKAARQKVTTLYLLYFRLMLLCQRKSPCQFYGAWYVYPTGDEIHLLLFEFTAQRQTKLHFTAVFIRS